MRRMATLRLLSSKDFRSAWAIRHDYTITIAESGFDCRALEQRQYWNKTANETQKTVRAVRQLIDRTNRQVNDVTLPAVTVMLGHVDSEVFDISTQLQTSLATVPPVMRSADKAIRDIDALSINPDIAITPKNVQGITANVNHTTLMPDQWVTRTLGKSKIGALDEIKDEDVWRAKSWFSV